MEEAAVAIFNLGFYHPKVFVVHHRIVKGFLENRHNFWQKEIFTSKIDVTKMLRMRFFMSQIYGMFVRPSDFSKQFLPVLALLISRTKTSLQR